MKQFLHKLDFINESCYDRYYTRKILSYIKDDLINSIDDYFDPFNGEYSAGEQSIINIENELIQRIKHEKNS